MQTSVDEIAPNEFWLSIWIPGITEDGFTFSQFLLTGDEPFLFHTGMRQLFPLVSEAISRVVPVEKLRWISFGHLEADECGAVNMMLAAAPSAEVIHGSLAITLSLADMCDRAPVAAPGRWRLRHRRTPAAIHRHTAHSARPGERHMVRRGDRHTARGRSVHPHRSRPHSSRPTSWSRRLPPSGSSTPRA
jgi:hypothetical protein